jgi:hypothetical protein
MNLKGNSSVKRSCLAKQHFHEHNFENFDLLLWVGFCNFFKKSPGKCNCISAFFFAKLFVFAYPTEGKSDLSTTIEIQGIKKYGFFPK